MWKHPWMSYMDVIYGCHIWISWYVMSVRLASSWSFGSGRIVHHFLRKILLVPRQMSGDSNALCIVSCSWLVNPDYNWTSWRTAHNSRLSTDHREKSICEVIKSIPHATVMHVQEVVQYSMFTQIHSFKMFQDVSSNIVTRSFRTVSLAGWAANTLNQASLGTWTGCAPQIFIATPPNPLDQKTLRRWLVLGTHPLRVLLSKMTKEIKWWCEPLAHLWCTLPLFHAWWPGQRALLWSALLKMVWHLISHQHARKTLEIKGYMI